MEVETRISALEDQGQNIDVTVSTATKTIAQLQEKVTYLEDAGRRNNVRIVGIEEGAEDRDMQKFVQKLLAETLDIEMGPEFEIEATETGISWCVSCGLEPEKRC